MRLSRKIGSKQNHQTSTSVSERWSSISEGAHVCPIDPIQRHSFGVHSHNPRTDEERTGLIVEVAHRIRRLTPANLIHYCPCTVYLLSRNKSIGHKFLIYTEQRSRTNILFRPPRDQMSSDAVLPERWVWLILIPEMKLGIRFGCKSVRIYSLSQNVQKLYMRWNGTGAIIWICHTTMDQW